MKKSSLKYIKNSFNPNWPQVPDHLYRILIIGSSGSGKKCITLFTNSSTTNTQKISMKQNINN